MDINATYDNITRIENSGIIPGAVAQLGIIPAFQFQIEADVVLTKVKAMTVGYDSVSALNVPLPFFEIRLLGGGTSGGIIESGQGSNLSIAPILSNKDFGGFSVFQDITLDFPEGMQLEKTGFIRAGLFWRFAAASATLRLDWKVDFYYKSPQPITILFEQA